MTSFIVPGNPVSQGRPRAGKRGSKIIMYDPKESKEYKQYVALIAKQYAPKIPYEGPLSVRLKIYRQIPKSTTKKDRALYIEGIKRPVVKPDTDNYTKAVLDALNGIIFKDDSQVTDLFASKYYSDKPRIEIDIQELDMLGYMEG
ncbi:MULTISPECIES: RusA family crossover junction endodeoxyribonuclease [unclassified Oceanobacillus]|uniref:RusA family crossover junction endodeoxyribonuclease n=1 Tax=unclassified Oceanobacillus TaxID=2630292 RepID=UPI001BEB67B6|nr:RusA family crossover junction endodeoxyribonuclease [Oceanobacillus sp. ISL-74]MBT2653320.1 RusA family crossover junction endodeoxyribonuclease [Oceanobacillus sp. ISL-73]